MSCEFGGWSRGGPWAIREGDGAGGSGSGGWGWVALVLVMCWGVLERPGSSVRVMGRMTRGAEALGAEVGNGYGFLGGAGAMAAWGGWGGAASVTAVGVGGE